MAEVIDDRRRFGRFCEDAAAKYLCRLGYRILERNYRTRRGEIDIIARDGRDLVFIEVKGKRSDRFGLPQEMVGREKTGRLIRTALSYLGRKARDGSRCRFDVMAVMVRDGAEPEIEHIRSAFGLDDAGL